LSHGKPTVVKGEIETIRKEGLFLKGRKSETGPNVEGNILREKKNKTRGVREQWTSNADMEITLLGSNNGFSTGFAGGG